MRERIDSECNGYCPLCHSNNISYHGKPEFDGDLVKFNFECRKCGMIGTEIYRMEYNHSYIERKVTMPETIKEPTLESIAGEASKHFIRKTRDAKKLEQARKYIINYVNTLTELRGRGISLPAKSVWQKMNQLYWIVK